LWGKKPLQNPYFPSPLKERDTKRRVREAKPLLKILPLPLDEGKGIKRVPRKIEDFSGCLKGIGL